MQLSFREVERLSRGAVFVAYHEWLEHMDVSQDADFIKGVRLSHGGVRNAGIAARPDGSGFYVATETALLQCDARAEVVKEIPLAEFDLRGGGFLWDTVTSSDRIWLTYLSGSTGSAIVEWQFDKPPATRLMVPVKLPGHIAVDCENRSVYVPFDGGVVDFNKITFEDVAWGTTGEYYFADFDPARGLLLSSAPTTTTRTITHLNPASGDRMAVTDGS